MSRLLRIAMLAGLIPATSATATPGPFWTFGFYFPSEENRRAGGLAEAIGKPVEIAKMAVPDNGGAHTADRSPPTLPFVAVAQPVHSRAAF